MIKKDYHLHSTFSTDSNVPLEEIVKKSISLGLDEICITDHHELDNSYSQGGFIITDIPKYINSISELKEKYKKEIAIKVGIEIGLQSHLTTTFDEIINKYPFDFVIGSTHSVNKIDISFDEFYKNKTPDRAHQDYFEAILTCLKKFDNYSVVGHLDFISRYGGKDYKKINYKYHQDVIDEILKTIINSNRGIEINTSGFRYNENRFYPTPEIVKRYYELGGEILTVGSDSHRVEHIGMDFQIVLDFLKSINVKYLTSFENKNPFFYKI